jgi:hypothetical protein
MTCVWALERGVVEHRLCTVLKEFINSWRREADVPQLMQR